MTSSTLFIHRGFSYPKAEQEQKESGVSISRMYDIDTDYWYIFTNHNYFIYRIEAKKVVVVQMFNEREDFMMKLFGISGRTQESIDYWGE